MTAPPAQSVAVPDRPGPEDGDRPGPVLTDLQLEILALVACGLTNRAVGVKVGKSEQTVKTHIKAVLRRLRARDRTHAVAIAYQRGLITMPSGSTPRVDCPAGRPARATAPTRSTTGRGQPGSDAGKLVSGQVNASPAPVR